MVFPRFISRGIWLWIFFIILLSFQTARADSEIKIGFVGSISGITSDVDVNVRDGVLFGIEEINRNGGIDGKKLRLIIRDDKRNEEEAKRLDTKLIREGVIAIIGHTTSSMTIAGKTIADKFKKVLISPTAASSVLSRKKDYVVCINSNLKQETRQLANLAVKELGVKKIACFYDEGNPTFTKDYLKWLSRYFIDNGGEIVQETPFNSQDMSNFWKGVSQLKLGDIDGVVIVAAPLHSAILVQKVRKVNRRIVVMCSSWCFTPAFLKEGGKAVENVWLCADFDPDSNKPSYLKYQGAYKDLYGRKPDFFSSLGYETTIVLRKALMKTSGESENLLKFIPGKYKGLQGQFIIDEFGDAHRDWYLLRVQKGAFKTVKRLTE